ncbi:MAG: hypothetical protein BWK76_14900 [Desulfobulbaceae bacterium A2]|nr:MAG: hypothetical protein BWK76_14900 [Desulfobulbaceae bacterium A2]
MLDSDASLRLKMLRFPPIIGVIYIHAYGKTIDFAGSTLGPAETNALTDFIRVLISECLARTAVPVFFLLSGYLFFINFQLSQQGYWDKLRSRCRSLLLPFLFWNVFVLSVVLLAQALPTFTPYFPEGSALVENQGVFQYLDALLGLTRYPIAYHFWFVRDLMLLALLSPLLAVILRCAALPFFLVVYFCWVSGTWPLTTPAAVGVFFFSAGAFCAIRGQSLFALDRFGPLALVLSLPILLADVVWNTAWFNNYLHRTGMIVGVVAILYSTRLAVRHQGLQDMLVALGGTSFFVYAAHEPLLGFVRTLAYRYVPLDGPYTLLLLYLTIPLLVVATLVACYRLLSLCCPRALGLITGGR